MKHFIIYLISLNEIRWETLGAVFVLAAFIYGIVLFANRNQNGKDKDED